MGNIFQPVRDGQILFYLYRYRFLQTKLLSLLLDDLNPVVVRRRWRALEYMGYVFQFPRQRTDEAVYALSGQGFKYIADELGVSVRDLPYSRKNSQVQPHFLYHSLQTIKFIVNAEIGLKNHDVLEAVDFFPEWQHQNVSSRIQEEKYLIKERVFIDANRSLPCHPDAVSVVNYNGPHVAFYVESDRSSEDMKRILRKLQAYWLLYQQGLYRERFRANAMVVLFTLSRIKTEKRIRSMIELLSAFVDSFPSEDKEAVRAFTKCILFTKMSDVTTQSVWTEPIWHNFEGEKKALYTPKQQTVKGVEVAVHKQPGKIVSTAVIHEG